MHLEDLGAEAIHLGITPRGQAGDAGAYDNDGPVSHQNPLLLVRNGPITLARCLWLPERQVTLVYLMTSIHCGRIVVIDRTIDLGVYLGV
jgi:hypothetical protein